VATTDGVTADGVAVVVEVAVVLLVARGRVGERCLLRRPSCTSSFWLHLDSLTVPRFFGEASTLLLP